MIIRIIRIIHIKFLLITVITFIIVICFIIFISFLSVYDRTDRNATSLYHSIKPRTPLVHYSVFGLALLRCFYHHNDWLPISRPISIARSKINRMSRNSNGTRIVNIEGVRHVGIIVNMLNLYAALLTSIAAQWPVFVRSKISLDLAWGDQYFTHTLDNPY